MHDRRQTFVCEQWLARGRSQFVNLAPQLLPLFDTYVEETLFGGRYIDSDLAPLRPGPRFLQLVPARCFLVASR